VRTSANRRRHKEPCVAQRGEIMHVVISIRCSGALYSSSQAGQIPTIYAPLMLKKLVPTDDGAYDFVNMLAVGY
jgi:hypothetical protein